MLLSFLVVLGLPEKSGELLNTIAKREPPSLTGFILDIKCIRNKNDPSETEGNPAPKRPPWPLLSCSAFTEFSIFCHFTPKGGLVIR